MEALLSLSFDNISSRDTSHIRKGLRQIEGLLAQICTSSDENSLKPHASVSAPESRVGTSKALGELKQDAAFREFFRLQEGFQWNVASRLITALERLMGMHNDSQTDLAILSTLDLLQGMLLLHSPSRCLFAREDDMNLVLDLLDYTNPPKVQSQALLVLVTALLDCPKNTRVFENVDGLLTVTSLFKSRGTTQEVKMRTLEFLYFYLMPETSPLLTNSLPVNSASGVSKPFDVIAKQARTHSGDDSMQIDTESQSSHVKTVGQKQRILGKYINNVAELVNDLQENQVFASNE